MLLRLLLIISTAQSLVVQARFRHHRNAQLVDPAIAIVALEQSSSSVPTSTTIAPSITVNVLDATLTLSRITSSASPSSVSTISCTPQSICVDAITCSIRYGGCYDKNYCNGNTSPYPIPTCDSSPANGLTSNNVAPARQREDPDIAGEVIVNTLMNARVGAD